MGERIVSKKTKKGCIKYSTAINRNLVGIWIGIKHLFEDNSSSWYDENELELVKGIDEITEEKDLIEYKRLKDKFS